MTELLREDIIRKTENNPPSGSPPYSSFIQVNNQLIADGLEIATRTMKIFNEFILTLTKFNMGVMKMWWNPFLYFPQSKSEN